MTRFIQLHALTVYPLSNPNRDDTGRPKSAVFGGTPRLRLSSQALKRAIRTSDSFRERLEGHLGRRTQRIGELVLHALAEQEIPSKKAMEIATTVTDVFGKIDAKKQDESILRTRQLAFVSPDEERFAIEQALKIAQGEKAPSTKELKKLVLRQADGAADVAMFGRMLADDPEFNREAAVQLSHAFTTHKALVEDDYYTAVDDLKKPEEDAGAGFVGEAGFGSGVFYIYACIDRELLERNLDGDAELATASTEAFVNAMASATPSGKRSSFAHQTRASFFLAEKGEQQPRSLAAAFLSAVRGSDLLGESIRRLEMQRTKLAKAYGESSDETLAMNMNADDIVPLADVATFAGKA